MPDWETIIWRPEQGSNNTFRTEIGMPAVSMVNMPPGVAGTGQGVMDTSGDSAEAALARS